MVVVLNRKGRSQDDTRAHQVQAPRASLRGLLQWPTGSCDSQETGSPAMCYTEYVVLGVEWAKQHLTSRLHFQIDLMK